MTTTPASPNPANPPPRGGLDRIVGQLTQDLDQVRAEQATERDRRREATGLIAEIIPRLGQLDTALGQTQAQLGETQAQLEKLVDAVDTLTGASQKLTPVHWPTLTAQEASGQWTLLSDWVEHILCGWYELTRIELPDCWPMHGRIVIELSWLHTCYLAAYGPKAIPHLAGEWHTRWRRDALTNIGAATSEHWCRPGEHLIDSMSSSDMRRAHEEALTAARKRRNQDSRDEPSLWDLPPEQRQERIERDMNERLRDRYLHFGTKDQHYHGDPEPSQRKYWEHFLRIAIAADLQRRRAQDAQDVG